MQPRSPGVDARGHGSWSARIVVDAWPLLLAVVLAWPLLSSSGYPLARDLVFTPRVPWGEATFGVGDAAPRAVPLDAVMAALTWVLDGAWWARLLVPGVLALAGWGTHRLLPGAGVTARLAAGGFAVWNPWVVERLALGQWALLAGYAALPWLAAAVLRWCRSEQRDGLRPLAALVGWAGLAAVTPTGGLLAVLVVAVLGLSRQRRTWGALGLVLLLQAPWVVAGVVGPATSTSDPAGVAAFAARGDGAGSAVVSLLGLGGIWDARSVPPSRETLWAFLGVAVVVVALVAGAWLLPRTWGTATAVRGAVLAALALGLAAASSLPGGGAALQDLVAHVPGAGVLRDAQKWLAPLVLLVAASWGALAGAVVARWRGIGTEVVASAGLVALLVPVLLLPDATRVTWPTVEPITYPAGLARVDGIVGGDGCRVATLPWRSYRLFSWGSGDTSSDPATRWLHCEVLVSDDLRVGGVTVRGEGVLAEEIGEGLADDAPAHVLAAAGADWALVYRDDPEAPGIDTTGLERVYVDADLALYRVPDAVAARDPSTAAVSAAVAAHLVWLLLVLAALARACLGHRSLRRRGSVLL